MTSFKVNIPESEVNSFKEYLERIGGEFEEHFDLSDDYKKMMDEVLSDYEKGKLEFISEEDFRKQISSK